MEDLMKLDLYDLLQIQNDATEKEIKTAYRKKALSCHPDKNPDNPKAAELFQQLSKALEILTDGAAKVAYDKLLKARKQTEIRHKLLDSKRKKLKDDLEAREQAAREDAVATVDAAKQLQVEIERLRKEGSKKLEEERLLLKKQLEEDLLKQNDEVQLPRLKATWKVLKKDPENGGYNSNLLNERFEKYGEISCLVLGKKGGSALIEFMSSLSALAALNEEKGIPENPLTITWVRGQPIDCTVPLESKTKRENSPPQTLVNEKDYESLVLRRMRQAEERKRLINEIQKEDG